MFFIPHYFFEEFIDIVWDTIASQVGYSNHPDLAEELALLTGDC